MRRPNLTTLVILASSLLFIHLIGLVNSSLGSWGFYLYLPGLFFLAPTVHLERFRATLVIVIIGFSLDLQNNTPFGFHATALIIFHLIGTDWVQIGKQGELIRPFILQIMANFLISITLMIATYSFSKNSSAWSLYRFCSDSMLSILIFIPLSRWFPLFCEDLLLLARASGDRGPRPA